MKNLKYCQVVIANNGISVGTFDTLPEAYYFAVDCMVKEFSMFGEPFVYDILLFDDVDKFIGMLKLDHGEIIQSFEEPVYSSEEVEKLPDEVIPF